MDLQVITKDYALTIADAPPAYVCARNATASVVLTAQITGDDITCDNVYDPMPSQCQLPGTLNVSVPAAISCNLGVGIHAVSFVVSKHGEPLSAQSIYTIANCSTHAHTHCSPPLACLAHPIAQSLAHQSCS